MKYNVPAGAKAPAGIFCAQFKFQFVALLNIVVGNAVPRVPKRFRGFDAP